MTTRGGRPRGQAVGAVPEASPLPSQAPLVPKGTGTPQHPSEASPRTATWDGGHPGTHIPEPREHVPPGALPRPPRKLSVQDPPPKAETRAQAGKLQAESGRHRCQADTRGVDPPPTARQCPGVHSQGTDIAGLRGGEGDRGGRQQRSPTWSRAHSDRRAGAAGQKRHSWGGRRAGLASSPRKGPGQSRAHWGGNYGWRQRPRPRSQQSWAPCSGPRRKH